MWEGERYEWVEGRSLFLGEGDRFLGVGAIAMNVWEGDRFLGVGAIAMNVWEGDRFFGGMAIAFLGGWRSLFWGDGDRSVNSKIYGDRSLNKI